jgi:IMP dehydrogenase
LTAIMLCAGRGKRRGSPSLPTGDQVLGDITKADRAGASAVMIGSLFAGTEESPAR